ncbi:hypothetical protein OAF56_02205 [Pirellulaceae bacterium]|nr:hypothetical protein [Pirellulaceae bacterium]
MWESASNVFWGACAACPPVNDRIRLNLEHRMGKDKASEEHTKKHGPVAEGIGW